MHGIEGAACGTQVGSGLSGRDGRLARQWGLPGSHVPAAQPPGPGSFLPDVAKEVRRACG